jgi:DNA-binding protein HU-beta
VNKAELIDTLAARFDGNRRQAQQALDTVIDTIKREVAAGERVAITGFGVFEKVERAARTARNPRTGATVRVKKTSVPKFKAGTEFKAVVSGAKKLPKVAAASVSSATKSAAKKATAKKAPAKKASAKKTVARKAPAKKTTAKKTVARKAPARKTTAKKTTAKKTTARKAPARKR